MKRVVDTCKKHNVVVGHPHVEQGNAERVVRPPPLAAGEHQSGCDCSIDVGEFIRLDAATGYPSTGEHADIR